MRIKKDIFEDEDKHEAESSKPKQFESYSLRSNKCEKTVTQRKEKTVGLLYTKVKYTMRQLK